MRNRSWKGEARPTGEVNVSKSNQMAKMLQMGSALLLELSDEDRVAILDDTRRTLTSEAPASVSTDTDDSSSLSVKPNDALVRQLCGCGYSVSTVVSFVFELTCLVRNVAHPFSLLTSTHDWPTSF